MSRRDDFLRGLKSETMRARNIALAVVVNAAVLAVLYEFWRRGWLTSW